MTSVVILMQDVQKWPNLWQKIFQYLKVSMFSIDAFAEQTKYTYRYESFLNPAKIPNQENQIAKLHLNGTVDLHILRNGKAIIKVRSKLLKIANKSHKRKILYGKK